MKALVRTPEGPRYGIIMSRHRAEEAAKAAYDRAAHRTSGMPHLMYRIVDLPTAAGGNGRVGDRIPIDLTS